MAGLGINAQGQDMPPLERPTMEPISPPLGPQTGFIDCRAVFETPNGIATQPPPQRIDDSAPKPKTKGGANAMIEQLRQQAAARMEAIQRQLKEADEAALAEEAA